MKRIVTVQDLSCLGKCSLTVALPVLSAMGVETAVLPTAVLSAHTKFQNVTFHDLTDQIQPISAHWQQEGVTFDGIYTGYLGSPEQAELVCAFVDAFHRENTKVIVDPVMGDNGRLYTGISREMCEKMKLLCQKADIILPNITEACYLTGMEYREDYDSAYIDRLLQALSRLCKGVCILTGVSFQPGQIGVMGRAGAMEAFHCTEKLPVSYHGTGDIFAAAFSGAVLRGRSWQQAAQIAADYTGQCIRLTMEDTREDKYGVHFERALPKLIRVMEEQ